MPDADARRQTIERIAHLLQKHLTPAEAGYSAPLHKFRWDQMTKGTQQRFLAIAEKVYDGVVSGQGCPECGERWPDAHAQDCLRFGIY